jgi:uncharacterized protein YjdB
MGAMIRRFSLPLVAALVLFAACSDALGPEGRQVRLVMAPTFGEIPAAAQGDNPAALVDNVRVVLVDMSGDTVLDQTVPWPVGQDTLRLEIEVEVSGTESFELELQGRIGDQVVFRAGPLPLDLSSGDGTPPQISPVLEFAGAESSITAVAITGAPESFEAGSTVALGALGTLSDGSQMSGPLMRWTSLDPAAATVSEDGVVQVGHDASRTVSIEGRVAFTDVSATVGGPVHPSALQVTASDTELTAVGAETEVDAAALGADGAAVTGAAVTWTSRSPDVLELADGAAGATAQVRAAGTGEGWVIAESGAVSDSVLIRVRQAAARVVLAGTPDTLRAVGETAQVEAEVYDANDHLIAEPEIVWSSGDPDVATVDQAGVVTAVADGSTWIGGAAGEGADSVLVTVAVPRVPAAIAIEPSTQTVGRLGSTAQFTASVRDQYDEPMTDPEITWSSLQPDVATVDPDGVATATGHGGAWIVARAGAVADTATLNVQGGYLNHVTVSPALDTLPEVGATTFLTATGRDRFGDPVDGVTFTWSSSNPAVATVDGDGMVTAQGGGTTEIVASTGDLSGAAAIVVVAEEVIFGKNVLYFSDYAVGHDAVLTGLLDLAQAGWINLAVATSRDDLLGQMGSEPDILIYFNQNTWLRSADEAALVEWVEAGKRLIFSDWTRNHTVFSAMETGRGSRTNETSMTFSDTRLIDGVQQPMPLSNPGWGIYSTGLNPIGAAVSVCTFPSGESCLVYGNGGRTITVGFLNDTVTEQDGRNFTRNLLRIVVQGDFRVAETVESALSWPALLVEPGLGTSDALPKTNALSPRPR